MFADRVTRGWVIVMTSVLGISGELRLAGDFHVRRIPEAAERPVRLEPHGDLARIHSDGADGGGFLAVHRAAGGPGGRAQGSIAVRGGVRRGFLLSGAGEDAGRAYAIYILLGVVGNGTTQLCYARVISAWFDRRRGLALATMMAGVGAGAIGIPPLATWLIEAYGWREAYLLLGASVFVLGMIPAALWLRETPPDAELATLEKSLGLMAGMRGAEAVRMPVFWFLLTGFFLFSVSVNGSVAHLIPILTDRGIASETAALAASTLGVLTLCGRLLTGVLLDRFFGSRVAGNFFRNRGSWSGGPQPGARSRDGVLGAALIGLGMGAEADVMPYLISRYFGLASFSEIYGYAFTAYALAGALGPLLMGWSFDRFHSYSTVLLCLAAAMFTGAAVLASLPRYRFFASTVEPLHRNQYGATLRPSQDPS